MKRDRLTLAAPGISSSTGVVAEAVGKREAGQQLGLARHAEGAGRAELGLDGAELGSCAAEKLASAAGLKRKSTPDATAETAMAGTNTRSDKQSF